MSFNVDEFRKNLRWDGARPNLFEVEVPFMDGTIDRSFRFMCKAASIPGSNLGVVEVPYFGRQVKVAGNRTYDEWTVTIINDETFDLRNKFEEWHKRLNAPVENTRAALNSLFYTRDAKVTHFRKNGSVIKTYSLVGAFPSNIAPIDLDWGSNDTIEEFTVTFAYQYWIDSKLSKSTAPEQRPSNQEVPQSNALPAGPTGDTTLDGLTAATTV